MKKILFFLVMVMLVIGISGCKKSHKDHNDDDDSSKSEMSSTSASAEKTTAEESSNTYDDITREFLESIDYDMILELLIVQNGINDPGLVSELKAKMPKRMVAVYLEYFTVDELKELTGINNDRTLRRSRELLPQLYQSFINENKSMTSGNSSSAQNQVSSEFAAAMAELMEVMNFDEYLEDTLPVVADANDLSLQVQDFYRKNMRDIMMRVYSKHFSADEIKQLTILMKIPIYKKYLEKQADINSDVIKESEKIETEYYKTHAVNE